MSNRSLHANHPSTCRKRISRALSLALLTALFYPASQAGAYHIGSVSVSPDAPNTPSDSIVLTVNLWTGFQATVLYQPTQISITGPVFSVDIFATTTCEQSGADFCAAIPDSLQVIAPLGSFAPGEYDFKVTTHRPTAGDFDTFDGNFTVVPEPSTLALMAGGLALIGSAARRRN